MSRIHPTAVVSPSARLEADVSVGAFSVIGAEASLGAAVVVGCGVIIEGAVRIGPDSEIGHYVVMKGPLTVGARNRVYPHCVFGEDGQYPGAVCVPNRQIVVGHDNTWREHVTVHQPTTTATTKVGDRGYFMVQTHLSHDVVIGDGVKCAMGVTLAGFVQIGSSAYLGMHAVVRQRLRVGEFSMVGMNASVVKHVPPGAVMVGQRFAKPNSIGLQAAGYDASAIDEMCRVHRAAADGVVMDSLPFDSLGEKASRFYREITPEGFYLFRSGLSIR